MNDVLSSTLPIFLLALLGSIIKRKWLTSEEFWRSLEKLLYFLLFPTVLFKCISTADLSSSEVFKVTLGLILATLVIAIGLVIYQRKSSCDKAIFTSIFQGAVRYNTYVFLGLGDILFGTKGLEIISVITCYMIVFTNILSIVAFAVYVPSPASSTRESLKIFARLILSNPLIIASVLAFMFNYAGFKLSDGLQNTLISLSNSAFAIGMMNVGAGLKLFIDRHVFKQVMIASTVKLLILPIVTACILSMMSIHGLARSVGIFYSCLPCATTAYVLSKQLGGHPDSMVSIITVTTIFSVVSLSFLMYLLG